MDPTRRFSSRVEHYVKYRPSYPTGMIPFLAGQRVIAPGHVVADVGSGTGLLSEPFLEYGCRVIGVEPNREMREAGDAMLAGHPSFSSVDGRAEATTLREASVDLVVAGQAFHWFEPAAARTEFARILRPPHNVLLVWNDRRTDAGTLMHEYESLLKTFGTDYTKVDHRRIGAEQLGEFFGPEGYREHVLPNRQSLDREGFEGRLMSSSYVPAEGAPGHPELIEACRALFDRYQSAGRVALEYDTRIYWGRIGRAKLPPGAP